jgi:PAS domain S-box-containing protein
MIMHLREFVRDHWIGIGVGGIGWTVNIFHFLYMYLKYGNGVLTYFRALDNILVLVWIPGFMLAGYLYDRKLVSERRLAASKERYRVFVENALDGINIVDREGNFVLVNQEYCRMLGYTRKELIGESFLITFPEEDRKEGRRLFKKTIREHAKPYTYEGRHVRKDGSILDVQIKWNYLHRDGRVIGTIAVVRDITERKRAEDEIRRLKDFSESVINGITDAILIIDIHDFRVVSANKAFINVLGLRREEVIGKTCYELTHNRTSPCLPPNDPCPIEELMKTGRPTTMEHVHLDDNNGKCFVEVSAHPIFENGAITQVVHITRDITKRRRAEEELKKYAQELEWSNRLKDLFTDIMRHDLLNPVTVIKGISQILRQGCNGDMECGLEKIERSAFKLEEMIETAARLSKLEDQRELRFAEEDLNSIFREVVHSFSPTIAEKSMRVNYLPEDKCLARVCPFIDDVFTNLLSNAIKYSPPNSTITIDILDKGDAWKIMVADHGEGVPDEYKAAIFERFNRGGKAGVKGTGLGLAIVKRVVELHKGKVWVEDNFGGGSIFYVLIPKNYVEVSH